MSLINDVFQFEPWEQQPIRFNWAERAAGQIEDGYAYSSHEVKIFNDAGVEEGGMLASVPTRSGDWIYVWLTGGTTGEDYWCRCRVILTKAGSPDYKIEGNLLVQVREEGA
jgi:hypothetical protein